MGWKLSRRTHQRFRHFRVWRTTAHSDKSCKSTASEIISEKKFHSTKTLESSYINNLDGATKTKVRNMAQLPIQ